ncbi:MAG: SAM-dependent methyltransferase [Hyphomicrobiales bacterium]|nr:MAG: SAM-dependent methyltransferase [Hyphomicrobiales bacterium]
MEEDLYTDPLLAQFYDSASQNRVDFECCLGLAKPDMSILDLGCGTGELAVGLAKIGAEVTGVEPAGAMLDIARGRDVDDLVTWVQDDARNVRLGRKFDLVILTGHSFQGFLIEADQMKLLATIAAHLTPKGRFVFDSRNPDFMELKGRKVDDNIRLLEHELHGQIEMWNVSDYDEDKGILTYENGFRIVATGEEHVAGAKIHYTKQQDIADMLVESGLFVDRWLGDWLGGEYHAKAREIIPFGGLA